MSQITFCHLTSETLRSRPDSMIYLLQGLNSNLIHVADCFPQSTHKKN